jgi:hypothetical protein
LVCVGQARIFVVCRLRDESGLLAGRPDEVDKPLANSIREAPLNHGDTAAVHEFDRKDGKMVCTEQSIPVGFAMSGR